MCHVQEGRVANLPEPAPQLPRAKLLSRDTKPEFNACLLAGLWLDTF